MHAQQARRFGDVAAGFLQGPLNQHFLGVRQIEREGGRDRRLRRARDRARN